MNSTGTRLGSILVALGVLGLAACGGSPGRGVAYAPADPPEAPADEAETYDGEPAPAAEEAPGSLGISGSGRVDVDVRPAQPSARSTDRGETYEPAPRQPTNRPGLGTEWGENRYSRVTSAPFVRAQPQSPFSTAKLFYNDRQGIQDMLDAWGGRPTYTTRFAVHGGHLSVALRGGNGAFLSGFNASGRDYVTGSVGDRYSIVVDNNSPGRIEAVVSVDGLDVIDGRPASFGKRGYLLDPHGHLEIEGFRRSEQEVAAFRFGSVRSSYASQKHGDTRNVGVIGFAFFHEQGDSPSYWSQPYRWDEAERRHSADPFPNQYATPPN